MEKINSEKELRDLLSDASQKREIRFSSMHLIRDEVDTTTRQLETRFDGSFQCDSGQPHGIVCKNESSSMFPPVLALWCYEYSRRSDGDGDGDVNEDENGEEADSENDSSSLSGSEYDYTIDEIYNESSSLFDSEIYEYEEKSHAKVKNEVEDINEDENPKAEEGGEHETQDPKDGSKKSFAKSTERLIREAILEISGVYYIRRADFSKYKAGYYFLVPDEVVPPAVGVLKPKLIDLADVCEDSRIQTILMRLFMILAVKSYAFKTNEEFMYENPVNDILAEKSVPYIIIGGEKSGGKLRGSNRDYLDTISFRIARSSDEQSPDNFIVAPVYSRFRKKDAALKSSVGDAERIREPNKRPIFKIVKTRDKAESKKIDMLMPMSKLDLEKGGLEFIPIPKNGIKTSHEYINFHNVEAMLASRYGFMEAICDELVEICAQFSFPLEYSTRGHFPHVAKITEDFLPPTEGNLDVWVCDKTSERKNGTQASFDKVFQRMFDNATTSKIGLGEGTKIRFHKLENGSSGAAIREVAAKTGKSGNGASIHSVIVVLDKGAEFYAQRNLHDPYNDIKTHAETICDGDAQTGKHILCVNHVIINPQSFDRKNPDLSMTELLELLSNGCDLAQASDDKPGKTILIKILTCIKENEVKRFALENVLLGNSATDGFGKTNSLGNGSGGRESPTPSLRDDAASARLVSYFFGDHLPSFSAYVFNGLLLTAKRKENGGMSFSLSNLKRRMIADHLRENLGIHLPKDKLEELLLKKGIARAGGAHQLDLPGGFDRDGKDGVEEVFRDIYGCGPDILHTKLAACFQEHVFQKSKMDKAKEDLDGAIKKGCGLAKICSKYVDKIVKCHNALFNKLSLIILSRDDSIDEMGKPRKYSVFACNPESMTKMCFFADTKLRHIAMRKIKPLSNHELRQAYCELEVTVRKIEGLAQALKDESGAPRQLKERIEQLGGDRRCLEILATEGNARKFLAGAHKPHLQLLDEVIQKFSCVEIGADDFLRHYKKRLKEEQEENAKVESMPCIYKALGALLEVSFNDPRTDIGFKSGEIIMVDPERPSFLVTGLTSFKQKVERQMSNREYVDLNRNFGNCSLSMTHTRPGSSNGQKEDKELSDTDLGILLHFMDLFTRSFVRYKNYAGNPAPKKLIDSCGELIRDLYDPHYDIRPPKRKTSKSGKKSNKPK